MEANYTYGMGLSIYVMKEEAKKTEGEKKIGRKEMC